MPPASANAAASPTGTPSASPTDAPCPCGRGNFLACCGRYVGRPERPDDAESLMRSRYTAYVLDDRDYLLSTWHPSTRPASIEANAPGLRWLGLSIKRHETTGADTAVVEFVARSKQAGRAHRLHELSRFVRQDGRWLYLDGDMDPKPQA